MYYNERDWENSSKYRIIEYIAHTYAYPSL